MRNKFRTSKFEQYSQEQHKEKLLFQISEDVGHYVTECFNKETH